MFTPAACGLSKPVLSEIEGVEWVEPFGNLAIYHSPFTKPLRLPETTVILLDDFKAEL
jgi:hypothetical protein